jgi:hypothetical protein
MFSRGGIGALGGLILVRFGGRGGSWSLGGELERRLWVLGGLSSKDRVA